MTPTEAILGPTIGTTNNHTEVIHDTHTQVLMHIILTMTLHTAYHLHTGAHLLTYPRECSRSCSQSAYRPAKKASHQSSPKSRRPQGKTNAKRNSRVTIDDPHMDFYSSDYHSSDLEEDSDHLNYLSPLSGVHPMNGGPNTEETVIVVCIMDCPTITVHAGKCYKALNDSGQLFHFFDIQHTDTLRIVLKLKYSLQLQN